MPRKRPTGPRDVTGRGYSVEVPRETKDLLKRVAAATRRTQAAAIHYALELQLRVEGIDA